jgi:hypothetical protein
LGRRRRVLLARWRVSLVRLTKSRQDGNARSRITPWVMQSHENTSRAHRCRRSVRGTQLASSAARRSRGPSRHPFWVARRRLGQLFTRSGGSQLEYLWAKMPGKKVGKASRAVTRQRRKATLAAGPDRLAGHSAGFWLWWRNSVEMLARPNWGEFT